MPYLLNGRWSFHWDDFLDYCGSQKSRHEILLSPGIRTEHYSISPSQLHQKSRKLYVLVLVLTISSILVLPWIRIQSFTTTPGLVLPSDESIEIVAPLSGQIDGLRLKEGDLVRLKDTLFAIRENILGKETWLLAPESGYVHKSGGHSNGSIVNKGEKVFSILPPHQLGVKCFVSGKDIASIQPQQEIDFQIQSPKDHLKRAIRGKVTDILPPTELKNQEAVFEVHCSIDSLEMKRSPNPLRPGMTLLARFRLARRTAVDIILKEPQTKDQIPT